VGAGVGAGVGAVVGAGVGPGNVPPGFDGSSPPQAVNSNKAVKATCVVSLVFDALSNMGHPGMVIEWSFHSGSETVPALRLPLIFHDQPCCSFRGHQQRLSATTELSIALVLPAIRPRAALFLQREY
jgi:hypothetical protein